MENIIEIVKNKMDNTLVSLDKELTNIRTGRANPNMLNGISVSYYGSQTPLNQVASISVPEAQQLLVKPFDKTLLADIGKAIIAANIGVTPNNNGEVIILNIPALTEDRRKEFVKQVKSVGEKIKISIRNIRRDGIELAKKDEFSKDELKNIQDEIQNITNEYNNKIDNAVKDKEKVLMEI